MVFGEPKGKPKTKLIFGELERTPKTNWSSVNLKEHLGQSDFISDPVRLLIYITFHETGDPIGPHNHKKVVIPRDTHMGTTLIDKLNITPIHNM